MDLVGWFLFGIVFGGIALGGYGYMRDVLRR